MVPLKCAQNALKQVVFQWEISELGKKYLGTNYFRARVGQTRARGQIRFGKLDNIKTNLGTNYFRARVGQTHAHGQVMSVKLDNIKT